MKISKHEDGEKLPEDMQLEILLRASITTLSTCKFVRKSWCNTIKDAHFLTTYKTRLTHNNNNNFYILSRKGDGKYFMIEPDSETNPTIYTPKLPSIAIRDDTKHSCNGFLLFEYRRRQGYCICNPVTGDYIEIPTSPPRNRTSRTSIIWFGYDPISNACKIIRILHWPQVDGKTTMVNTFDVATRAWKEFKGDQLLIKSWRVFPQDFIDLTQLSMDTVTEIAERGRDLPSVFLEGALHWLCYWKALDYACIIAFKLDTEEFLRISLPSDFKYTGKHHLLVVQQCLSVVDGDDFRCIDIWVMNIYGFESTWEKRYKISNIMMDNRLLRRGPCMPVALMQSGEILLIYSESPKKLAYYHPVTGVFRCFESSDEEINEGFHSLPWFVEGNLESPAVLTICRGQTGIKKEEGEAD